MRSNTSREREAFIAKGFCEAGLETHDAIIGKTFHFSSETIPVVNSEGKLDDSKVRFGYRSLVGTILGFEVLHYAVGGYILRLEISNRYLAGNLRTVCLEFVEDENTWFIELTRPETDSPQSFFGILAIR